MPLNQLTDLQLKNLFTVTADGDLTARGKAILMELLIRGIVYDVRRKQFLTADQWTERYGNKSPAEYFADLAAYMAAKEVPMFDSITGLSPSPFSDDRVLGRRGAKPLGGSIDPRRILASFLA